MQHGPVMIRVHHLIEKEQPDYSVA
jgi:hypothetical protein